MAFAFGLFGGIAAFLFVWLGYVQVLQAAELEREDGRAPLRLDRKTAERQGYRVEHIPPARGSIVDRNGKPLAYDREVYDVRARLSMPLSLYEDFDAYRAWIGRRAAELALVLAGDRRLADRQSSRERCERRLLRAIRRAYRVDELERGPAGMLGKVPQGHRRHVDILVESGVDSLETIERLRALGARKDLRGLMALEFLPTHERVYPERELTYGIVGHTVTKWVGDGKLETFGVAGLEAAAVLSKGAGAERALLRDGRGRSYFLARAKAAGATPVLHSTLDIDLQRIACRELEAGVKFAAGDDPDRAPNWAAMVLVEVATGDIVAAASWHKGAGAGKGVAFTPLQSLFEPGSVVKPLVLSYAYEAGTIDWSHVYDCSPGGADYREAIGRLGRRKPVRDDHDCGDLTPHGIIVNSSNVGASLVGLTLSREQWADYMEFFGIGCPLDLPMPHGSVGGPNRRSFAPDVTERSFRANSAISFSFGYEHMVTAFHVARAYLRLLRGGSSELRACRGVECDGRWVPAPVSPRGATFSPRVLGAVMAAMRDVISPEHGATGRYLHQRMKKELGIDLHGVVAGKTGTAVSGVRLRGRKTFVRNASFVGLIPAEQPRWLAVCVMQRESRARFYGGSYAAPPVVRLLVRAERLVQRRDGGHQARPSDGQIR